MTYARKVDRNQGQIKQDLERYPNIKVALRHDDMLVGVRYPDGRRQTWWFEIKHPDRKRKDGSFGKNALQPSQERLVNEWPGQYDAATCADQILALIGIGK
jgi:hypothetical protein